jgi:hypothetical protein
MEVDSGVLRHGINRTGSWAPASCVATSASGIDAAILSPANSGEPWHIAGADPQMATPRRRGDEGEGSPAIFGEQPQREGVP